mgnify:CR=1 FL=1
MTLGQRIRERREALGLSQEQVAEGMGVSRQAVGKWESDDARPSTDNLLRLSSLLKMEVQELAAGQAPSPPGRRFPWRGTALGFAGLSLALALLLLASLPKQDAPEAQSDQAGQEQEAYPQSLSLERTRLYDFTPVLTEDAPAAEKLPGDWEAHVLCALPLGEGTLRAVALPSAGQGESPDQYDLWAVARSGPEAPWIALCRFAENCQRPEELRTDLFLSTLGCDRGWRLTLPASAWDEADHAAFSHYFACGEAGRPVLAFTADSGCTERDLDGDGERELISLCTYGWGQSLEIYDRAGDGFYLYSLSTAEKTGALGLDGAGFYWLDSPEGPRFSKLLGGALVRADLAGSGGDPSWDVLTPDVMDVTVTFALDQFSHGQDPDAVLAWDSLGRAMPTDRQYARLALHCLYTLTGWKPDSVWCLATDFGVHFSLYEDGFANRSYFSFDKWFDEENISALSLTWAEEADWSPLSAARAAEHLGTQGLTGMELAQAWYDRLSLISGGPIADQGTGPYVQPALFLADGRSYLAETNDALHVLTYLQGPYPADFHG